MINALIRRGWRFEDWDRHYTGVSSWRLENGLHDWRHVDLYAQRDQVNRDFGLLRLSGKYWALGWLKSGSIAWQLFSWTPVWGLKHQSIGWRRKSAVKLPLFHWELHPGGACGAGRKDGVLCVTVGRLQLRCSAPIPLRWYHRWMEARKLRREDAAYDEYLRRYEERPANQPGTEEDDHYA